MRRLSPCISLRVASSSAEATACSRAICCSMVLSSCCVRESILKPLLLPFLPRWASTMERRNSVPVITVTVLPVGNVAVDRPGLLGIEGFIRHRFLVNHSHGTAATQLLNPCDKTAVWQDIIAFRLHYHHEIAFPFHIEQYLALPFTLGKHGVEGVHGAVLSSLGLDADAQGLGKRDFVIFQRIDFVDGEAGVRPLFYADSSLTQARDFPFHFFRELAVGLGENEHIDRTFHVLEHAPCVHVTFFGLLHFDVREDAGGDDVFIFTGGGLHFT